MCDEERNEYRKSDNTNKVADFVFMGHYTSASCGVGELLFEKLMEYIGGQITEYFNLYEFRSRDNNVMLVNAATLAHIRRMSELRKRVGRPMKIDSGFRTQAFNKIVGGAPDSQHLLGIACDVPLPDDIKAQGVAARNRYEDRLKTLWLEICQADGIGGGFGYYNTFTHFDSRVVRSVFDKRTVELKTNGNISYVELDPLTLKYVDLSKSPQLTTVLAKTYKNFANGQFFFAGVRPIYLVVQDGVKLYDLKIFDYLIGKKGTLIIYKNGTVKVETLHSISNVSNIHLAFQGFNLNYDANGIKPVAHSVIEEQANINTSIRKEGYGTDVYRPCPRVGYGYNGKLVIANINGDANVLRKAMRSLGCIYNGDTYGIGVDSGSRNAFVVDGQIVSNGRAKQEHIIVF